MYNAVYLQPQGSIASDAMWTIDPPAAFEPTPNPMISWHHTDLFSILIVLIKNKWTKTWVAFTTVPSQWNYNEHFGSIDRVYDKPIFHVVSPIRTSHFLDAARACCQSANYSFEDEPCGFAVVHMCMCIIAHH